MHFYGKSGLIFIGQFMVPRCLLSGALMTKNKPKSGHYMVPALAILWVKLQIASTLHLKICAFLIPPKKILQTDILSI
jgi:hypothetical protein